MGEAIPIWRICVDTGGTFTDAVAVDPDGRTLHAKVLSTGALRGVVTGRPTSKEMIVAQRWEAAGPVIEGMLCSGTATPGASVRVHAFSPEHSLIRLEHAAPWAVGDAVEFSLGEEAPVLAARLLTGTPPLHPLPPMEMRLATTRGTNALLTRRGGRVAFFVTRGFRDLLEIGTQQRPDLFALDVVKHTTLHERAVEVDERVSATGEVLRELDEAALRSRAADVRAAGIDCAAVALLHSDRFPTHEARVGAILHEMGFAHVTCSHEAPMIKLLPRAQTAVVDASLAPVIGDYLRRVADAMGGSGSGRRLMVLTSAGSLVGATDFRARDSLLSGPAGGVIGARLAAQRSGFTHAISFDMGGTSTDVARLDEDNALVFEHSVGDAHLVAPAVGVETVAAGGGSICGFDGVRPFVGPASAGANPGPACYGAGGPLTLTDVNLLLGRLDPTRFPIPIVPEASERAIHAVIARMMETLGTAPSRDDLLHGFLKIAAERMAGAVRRVSARQGYDPRGYTLVAFGGAGGQHAGEVAQLLGMRSVLIPSGAGVLSAAGLQAARIERMAERQFLMPLSRLETSLAETLDELAEKAIRGAEQADSASGASRVARARFIAAMRLTGQESTIEAAFEHPSDLPALFARRYREIYGHEPEPRPIELVWVRVIAGINAAPAAASHPSPPYTHPVLSTRRVYFDEGWRVVSSVERAAIRPGEIIHGPTMVFEEHGAVVVSPGWTVHVDPTRALVLRHESEAPVAPAADDEISLELFTSRCESIAKEMGEALRRTAVSTNVKERLDFSCAILDAAGELIVNAPHVPVHLGSLGLCVRSVREVIEMAPGDVVVTNHPALGGSHLPDVTIITPIHAESGELLGYAASRAHHAEIGGTRPGSMPPAATRLEEEGVIIAPMHLVRRGEARYEDVERVLRSALHPSRAVADNLADMRAAAAANRRGLVSLRDVARDLGASRVQEYFERIKDRGERAAGAALTTLSEGVRTAEEALDDGSLLRVRLALENGRATIDFTGSAAVHPGNLNATPAIVRSAVIYVLRLLVRDAIPLNEGLMRRVSLVLPTGMLNPDFSHSPAVAGGNVETSQRLVDTLLKALGVAACSQGTMNNLIFGPAHGDRAGYYETICGGCGATQNAPGASAVHSHMTNTRITDPEILETRFPVRLELFEIRRGSGGPGRHAGGDGVVRAITFLEPTALSLITQHRTSGPYGVEGGSNGAPGRQRIVRTSGNVHVLPTVAACELAPGDTLILETPGGGGWGAP